MLSCFIVTVFFREKVNIHIPCNRFMDITETFGFKLVFLLLYTRLQAVISHCIDVANVRNTSEYIAWTMGNEDPMHEMCIRYSLQQTLT